MKKIIAIIILLVSFPAIAAEQSAQVFLDEIYVHYQDEGGQAEGIPMSSEETIRQYFTPSLAELIIADDKAAAARGEVPKLDGDPFIGAQEWQISSFNMQVNQAEPGKADASISFNNYNEPKMITVLLIEEPEGWRIDDIRWDGGEDTLRGLYAPPIDVKPPHK